MMPLALIGLSLMAGLIGWGVWNVSKSITMKKTTDRYRYVKAKDEYGTETEMVLDLQESKSKGEQI